MEMSTQNPSAQEPTIPSAPLLSVTVYKFPLHSLKLPHLTDPVRPDSACPLHSNRVASSPRVLAALRLQSRSADTDQSSRLSSIVFTSAPILKRPLAFSRTIRFRTALLASFNFPSHSSDPLLRLRSVPIAHHRIASDCFRSKSASPFR